jgi:hypothetical protein
MTITKNTTTCTTEYINNIVKFLAFFVYAVNLHWLMVLLQMLRHQRIMTTPTNYVGLMTKIWQSIQIHRFSDLHASIDCA